MLWFDWSTRSAAQSRTAARRSCSRSRLRAPCSPREHSSLGRSLATVHTCRMLPRRVCALKSIATRVRVCNHAVQCDSSASDTLHATLKAPLHTRHLAACCRLQAAVQQSPSAAPGLGPPVLVPCRHHSRVLLLARWGSPASSRPWRDASHSSRCPLEPPPRLSCLPVAPVIPWTSINLFLIAAPASAPNLTDRLRPSCCRRGWTGCN